VPNTAQGAADGGDGGGGVVDAIAGGGLTSIGGGGGSGGGLSSIDGGPTIINGVLSSIDGDPTSIGVVDIISTSQGVDGDSTNRGCDSGSRAGRALPATLTVTTIDRVRMLAPKLVVVALARATPVVVDLLWVPLPLCRAVVARSNLRLETTKQ
jgi:hypothetical protein